MVIGSLENDSFNSEFIESIDSIHEVGCTFLGYIFLEVDWFESG